MEQKREFSQQERMGRVEGILEEVRSRLNHLESDIGRLDGKIDGLRQEVREDIGRLDGKIDGLRQEVREEIGRLDRKIDNLRGDIQTNFRWMVGIMLTIWVTVILTILFAPRP